MIATAGLDFTAVADALRRVTVEIAAAGGTLGAGLLWPRGHVVTNAHVIHGPRVGVRLVDGVRVEARLVARDHDADVAVLRISGSGLPGPTLAGPAAARVGALVIAVGHPFGVRGALTAGIIHAIAPIVPGGPPWIQADVRLAPGNSGGPLADVGGAIVGLNAMVAGGLALAVPIARVIDVVRAAGVPLT